MPLRGTRLRIEDMLLTIDRIESYTAGMTFEAFCADPKTIDAVIRNFEVMGEAARHVDDETARVASGVPWPDVRDMRNILIHEYFGVTSPRFGRRFCRTCRFSRATYDG